MPKKSKPDEGLTIRGADRGDIPLLLSLIRELAEYEHLLEEVVATEEMLKGSLLGREAVAEAVILEFGGELAGFAVYFHTFSTFMGRRGIYLEDLYVRPAFRGRGIGRATLVHLAQLAEQRNCGRLEWAVLDWNEPAIEFYRRLRAQPMSQWTTFRLTGEALAQLAERSSQTK